MTTRWEPTGRYGDVPMVPAAVLIEAGSFIEREYGEGYMLGYVGAFQGAYAFQVRARDGSRFAVSVPRDYGTPDRMKGREALEYLRSKNIEADIPISDEEN